MKHNVLSQSDKDFLISRIDEEQIEWFMGLSEKLREQMLVQLWEGYLVFSSNHKCQEDGYCQHFTMSIREKED